MRAEASLTRAAGLGFVPALEDTGAGRGALGVGKWGALCCRPSLQRNMAKQVGGRGPGCLPHSRACKSPSAAGRWGQRPTL